MKDYKTIKDFVNEPIKNLADYKGFYYVKLKSDPAQNMWRINKETGEVEFFDAFAFGKVLYEDGKNFSDLPEQTPEMIEEFKQFLKSF